MKTDWARHAGLALATAHEIERARIRADERQAEADAGIPALTAGWWAELIREVRSAVDIFAAAAKRELMVREQPAANSLTVVASSEFGLVVVFALGDRWVRIETRLPSRADTRYVDFTVVDGAIAPAPAECVRSVLEPWLKALPREE